MSYALIPLKYHSVMTSEGADWSHWKRYLFTVELKTCSPAVKVASSCHSIQVSFAHSEVLHYIADVGIFLAHPSLWQNELKEAEAALLSERCLGSIIGALSEIKHNITLSRHTLCS